jgi:hypothetical protein
MWKKGEVLSASRSSRPSRRSREHERGDCSGCVGDFDNPLTKHPALEPTLTDSFSQGGCVGGIYVKQESGVFGAHDGSARRLNTLLPRLLPDAGRRMPTPG